MQILVRSIPCSLVEAGLLEAINVGDSVSLKDRGCYQDEPVRSWMNILKMTQKMEYVLIKRLCNPVYTYTYHIRSVDADDDD